MESNNALDCLEAYVDRLISCSEEITKKCYIFGAYKDEKKIIHKDEKISSILNCKGMTFWYNNLILSKKIKILSMNFIRLLIKILKII